MSGITTGQIQWTAGFLEGEGSFDLQKNGIGIRAAQVQREPLERLLKYFGGSIVDEPPTKPQYQYAYRWHLFGKNGAALMMTLYPLMSPKRQEKMKKCLAFWKTQQLYGKDRTHCPDGHEYTPDNTRIYKNHRYCRICETRNYRKYVARRRAAALCLRNGCPDQPVEGKTYCLAHRTSERKRQALRRQNERALL